MNPLSWQRPRSLSDVGATKLSTPNELHPFAPQAAHSQLPASAMQFNLLREISPEPSEMYAIDNEIGS